MIGMGNKAPRAAPSTHASEDIAVTPLYLLILNSLLASRFGPFGQWWLCSCCLPACEAGSMAVVLR
jgi:hypothetical protein